MLFNEESSLADHGGFQYRQNALRNRLGAISKLHSTQVRNLRGGAPSSFVIGRRAGSSQPVAGGGFDKFLGAIAQQESGGNYGARGIRTRHGTALGKYQILDSNLSSWGREAVGRPVSSQEFLNSPQLQEQIARHKLQQYYQKYGPEGAAKAWYGGEGVARKSSNKKNNGGRFPSLNAYASAIARRMG